MLNIDIGFVGIQRPFNDYYACLFKSKVSTWRKAFRSPEMFYGYVSLAAYDSTDADGGSERSTSGLPRMRLDQNSVLSLPNTGVALALDLGDNGRVPFTPRSARHGGIHPRNKTEVARRMALAYAATGLNQTDVIATGPVFAAATATTTGSSSSSSSSDAGAVTVTVSFTAGSVGGGIAMSPTAQCNLVDPRVTSVAACCSSVPRNTNKGNKSITSDGGVPFELLDSHTGEFVLAAKTTISADGKSVVLVGPPGVAFSAVRYCEQGYPLCVLRNGAGLPAMPFLANLTAAPI